MIALRRGVLLLIALLLAVSGRAADNEPIPALGTEVFRSLLKHHGVRDSSAPTRLDGDFSTTILVIIDQAPIDVRLKEFSQEVIRQGGAVMIATDRSADVSQFFENSRPVIRVNGQLVEAYDAKLAYRKRPTMPFVQFDPLHGKDDIDLAAITAMKAVATNRPSRIEYLGQPFVSRILGRIAAVSATVPVTLPLMAVAPPEKGIAVLLADPDILSNDMLALDDTDNFAFAYRLASYLVAGPNQTQRRTRCVYYENGLLRRDFDQLPLESVLPQPELPTPPMPSWDQIQQMIVEEGNKGIARAQDDGGLSRRFERNIGTKLALQVAATVAATIVLILALRRSRTDAAPIAAVIPPLAGESIVVQRAAQTRHIGNIAEPVGEAIRAAFGLWGVPQPLSAEPPSLAFSGSARYQRRVRRDLLDLWMILVAPEPAAIPFDDWEKYSDMIERLSDAHRAGDWRFAATGGGR